jgi:hypothetical protein
MARWGWMGVSSLLIGCAVAPVGPAPSPTPMATPVASPPARPTAASPTTSAAIQLGGWWAIGGGDQPEPSPGASLNCPATVGLGQQGDQVSLSGRQYCGAQSDSATGTLQGNRLRLVGQHLRGRLATVLDFDLVYNPETGHLVGNRNGKPVWLVPHAPCPSVASLCTVPIQGDLYTEGGTLITEEVQVRIRTLNPSNPIDAVLTVTGGHYRMENAPLGMELEITAQMEGQAPVTRREVIERGPIWDVNFGGPKDLLDPEGWRYWVKPVPRPSVGPSGPSSQM